MLRVGGRMVYSTCSFNPIENEAVVAQLLRLSEGNLVLVDCSSKVEKLKRREGRREWKVVHRDGKEFHSFQQVPHTSQLKNPPSLFPPSPQEVDLFHLERCIRVLPHLQDTGGFFVAVLEKVGELPEVRGPLYHPLSLPSLQAEQATTIQEGRESTGGLQLEKSTGGMQVGEEGEENSSKKEEGKKSKKYLSKYVENPFLKYNSTQTISLLT